jgi:UDP-hydrolysing UDP-N-acetyl-D-glucosamine 2-epimerase
MKLGVVTVARSDFGIYEPLLEEIRARKGVRLQLIASGMHLAPEFGLTVREIEKAGYEVAAKVEMLLSSDTPEGTAKSTGLGIMGFAQLFSHDRPDWLVVLGDRFEMFAAVAAALPFRIPVAHIHGGELTFGAIDDAMRHCITKMSHLHFVSTKEYADRTTQLGEEPWRITQCGAPSLQNITGGLPAAELEKRFSVVLDPAPLLVSFHPVTLQHEEAVAQVEEMLSALEASGLTSVITLPNADAAGRALAQRFRTFVESSGGRARLVENFGRAGYFGMLQHCRAMVGNSSSGIIEAASFHLPVVNIGERQAGRARGRNVIDVGPRRSEILEAIHTAVSPDFTRSCRNFGNPYSPPPGIVPSRAILDRILEQPIDEKLLIKKFHDLWPEK